jgi:hypothetical protein
MKRILNYLDLAKWFVQVDTMLVRPVIPQTTTQEEQIFLEAVVRLIKELNQRHIRYCHWKSNLRLERSLCGQTDLDLLVDRDHEQAFKKILTENAIKSFLAPPGKRYPGIEDYLGFDPNSGRLFHLHVHYELVLGEQFVKNYRLPLENQFLDHIQFRFGVKIPEPELELIVLCLRILLKYRDRDIIKDIFTIRSPGLKSQMVDEIAWLLEQTSLEKISQTLTTSTSDVVPADVVLEFLNTVIATPRAGYKLYRLRSRARNTLRGFQRRNSFDASIEYFREAWRRRKSFWKFSPEKKMTLVNGGKTFALVGADGAGKSTLCLEIVHWLAWRVDVHSYYLGSKQPSWASDVLYWLFRIARRSHRSLCSVIGENNILSGSLESIRQVFLYGHFLSTGFDRYNRYQSGKKNAKNGSIAMFDRFPLQAPLDGPQIHMVANGKTGPISQAFSNAELSLYRKFHLPDGFIVLDVDPDVSMLRKPDHKRTVVEEKSLLLRELSAKFETTPNGLRIIRLDANQPFNEVVSQMKQKIWDWL